MIRALSKGEIALARSVFGGNLQIESIRLVRLPRWWARAFVAGRWFGRDLVLWPHATWENDISGGPLSRQAIFIHELVHVWQAQQGINLLVAKLKAGDGPTAYAYDCGHQTRWSDLNIEQQACVIEHRFVLDKGGTVPGDPAFYKRVCPF